MPPVKCEPIYRTSDIKPLPFSLAAVDGRVSDVAAHLSVRTRENLSCSIPLRTQTLSHSRECIADHLLRRRNSLILSYPRSFTFPNIHPFSPTANAPANPLACRAPLRPTPRPLPRLLHPPIDPAPSTTTPAARPRPSSQAATTATHT